ncbi:type I restriction-modification system subunit M [Prosthecochloris vibrioformis]|uniref:site-specific DNA-methyltransferase (adenine-specific) n=1 Tax=Prosthecochloris vibrioformis TaxID=1098 RepID=A0A5C4RZU1_PROVB|nr:N-6 DNA methylase [Prosthecochloris vibrioformis]TNJ36448.1 SAM-dependent DNA methyltransferase [Prosthecochloris vibrioformis]
MNGQTHKQIAGFIWSICNLLRGPYKRNEYRKVILPLTVLRRFECLLQPTRKAVQDEFQSIKTQSPRIQQARLQAVSGYRFYNLSKLQFTPSGEDIHSLLDDPNNLAPNLNSYINAFSPNVRAIMEKFKFSDQIAHMAEKNILFEVIKAFSKVDLSPQRVDQMQMSYVFEELIRIGAEQSNEEAGEHFTPREVIKLMVNLLLDPENDLNKSHVVKTIYDPACGTGGMLSVAEEYIRQLNSEARPLLYGQDWNDEAWAVCKSDMLIKGEDADNIIHEDTFRHDGFRRDEEGNKRRRIGDPQDKEKDPEHIADITRIYGNFTDADLRDTETVPLKVSIEEYFKREVLPHVPDAWIDHSKTKVGYEIPLNRHFYRYEPPRELEAIEADIRELEGEIVALLREVTA